MLSANPVSNVSSTNFPVAYARDKPSYRPPANTIFNASAIPNETIDVNHDSHRVSLEGEWLARRHRNSQSQSDNENVNTQRALKAYQNVSNLTTSPNRLVGIDLFA